MDAPTSATASANHLLDVVIDRLKCRNNSHLAARLGILRQKICHIRAGRVPVGPTIIISIHEETAMPIAEIKKLAGLPKAKPFDREFCNSGK